MENSQPDEKKVPKWVRIALIILSAIIVVLLVAFVIVFRKWQRADILTAEMFRANEENTISQQKVSELVENPNANVAAKFEEGVTIDFEGQKYRYNDNLINRRSLYSIFYLTHCTFI